jgi:hypothetical protein
MKARRRGPANRNHERPLMPRSVVLLSAVLVLTAAAGVRAASYPGYTLYSPNNGTATYLVDAAHTTVHTWTHSRPGGYSAYLQDDGSVLRPALSTNSTMNGGAAAGLVQRVSSSNVLVWQYSYSSNTVRSHHDLKPMPNGNVLLIAWERKTATQAVQAGLDHSAEIWPDHIVEVQPTGATTGTIVWEWHAWNHLVQDYSAARDNYGVVADHPELLDVNLGDTPMGGDWMHINGISYDPVHDQIVISSHTLNEIYVIDHSTTTAQAAGHTGGNSGKGGDILYRWGMPANYDAPGTQYFRVVHCSEWIAEGLPGAGNILAFNNREGMGTSIVVELVPPRDGGYSYTLVDGQAYGPTTPTWTYTAAGFYTNHLGSCQRLPNGNTLVVESTSGIIFEVDAAGATQWTHTPGGEIARARRYGMDHPGIDALGLVVVDAGTPGPPARVELAQNHPNPFNPRTTIVYGLPASAQVSLKVFDARGHLIATLVDGIVAEGGHAADFDAAGLSSGVYFYRLQAGDEVLTRKLTLLE